MSLADALAAQDAATARTCKLFQVMQDLDPEDAAALTAAMESSMSSQKIQRALRDIAVSISDSTIKMHRRGDCACRR